MVVGRKGAQQPWWKQLSWNRPCTSEQDVDQCRLLPSGSAVRLLASSSSARLPICDAASNQRASKRRLHSGRARFRDRSCLGNGASLLPTVPVTHANEAQQDRALSDARGAAAPIVKYVDRGIQCLGDPSAEPDLLLSQDLMDYLAGGRGGRARKLPSLEASIAASLAGKNARLYMSSRSDSPYDRIEPDSPAGSRQQPARLPPLSHQVNSTGNPQELSFTYSVQDHEDGQANGAEMQDLDVDILDSEKSQDTQNSRRLVPSKSQDKLKKADDLRSPKSARKNLRPQSAMAKYGAANQSGARDVSRPASSMGNSSQQKPLSAVKSSSKHDTPRQLAAKWQQQRHVTVKEERKDLLATPESDYDDELQEEPIQKLRAKSFSRFNLIKRRSTKAEYQSDFQRLVSLMRRYNYTLEEIQIMRDEFNEFDNSGQGVLRTDEFLQVVRKRCGLTPSQPVPQHLVHPEWLSQFIDGDGPEIPQIDFETYLTWCMSKAYAEEMMVPDPAERHLRRVARDNNLLLPDVENVKDVFDSFDEDRSQHIDEAEFEKVIYVLMNARNPSDISPNMLKRFWREVDCDGSGAISFEEFLLWYFKFMGRQG